MNQSAVEWLWRWFNDNQEATIEEGNNAFQQAKEMDKQQKIEFAEWYKDIVNSTAYQDKDCQRLFQKTTSELYEEFIKTYGGNK